MLDPDPVRNLFGVEQTVAKFLKHFGQAVVEIQFRAEFSQFDIGGPIHAQGIEQHFHVGQLVIVAVLPHQLAAPAPKVLTVDPESGKNYFVLHVARTQGLIVIVNDRDGVLRRGHVPTITE